jgi:hypothetical protein
MFTDFYYHKLEVLIAPTETIQMNGWFCSSVRNNFLFAAEKIKIGKHTLREIFNTLPLQETHPFYKNLCESFPKGFYISVDYDTFDKVRNQDVIIQKNEDIKFSLILIGNTEKYAKYVVKALQEMCLKGIGKTPTPLDLKEVTESDVVGVKRTLFTKEFSHIATLSSPILLSDYLHQDKVYNEVTFSFQTPTLLTTNKSSKKPTCCNLSDLNGFPNFYQLISAILHRLEKLWALYISPMEENEFYLNYQKVKDMLHIKYNVELRSVNLKHQPLLSTPKKGCETIIPLSGFVGRIKFKGDFDQLMPYILIAQELGIGRNIAYGLGNYKIEL